MEIIILKDLYMKEIDMGKISFLNYLVTVQVEEMLQLMLALSVLQLMFTLLTSLRSNTFTAKVSILEVELTLGGVWALPMQTLYLLKRTMQEWQMTMSSKSLQL